MGRRRWSGLVVVVADLPVVPAGSNPPEGERGLREASLDTLSGTFTGTDDFISGVRIRSHREAAGSEQVCRACGGSGHRNGSLRAADPFGTCPGCDGTGVQDRDAAHQFPTQHGFAVTVARALESAAEAVRRERLRIVDLIGSEFPDSMPLLAGDVIGMLQADFLDRAAQR